MIKFEVSGNFNNLEHTLKQNCNGPIPYYMLRRFGEEGVRALEKATPKDTGKTANSWSYEISKSKDKATLYFNNSNINNGVPIAILLQYGHATRNGTWVEGTDYINPAIKPIFEQMARNIWKEVTR